MADLPHIPFDVVRAHILPHLDIDVRVAFRVTKALDPTRHAWLDNFLKRRLRAVKHSPASGLTWCKLRVPCTGKVLVYRAHAGWRGCDLVDYSKPVPNCTTLWDYDTRG